MYSIWNSKGRMCYNLYILNDRRQNMDLLTLVVSVYNEEKCIRQFYDTTKDYVDAEGMPSYEMIFVNDGSTDGSLQILKDIAASDPQVRVISFSRNFGHEAAMIAGIDHARGDGLICMDADLQHHPRYLKDIVRKFEEGYDVISMVRTENKGVPWFKKIGSKLFYKCLNALTPVKFEENSSDFFGLSAKASNVLKNEYREKVRYLRGFVQIIGFQKCSIEYESENRIAGNSKYSIMTLMRFGFNAMCNFSDVPLKLGVGTGLLSALIGVVLLIYSLYQKIANGAPAGYTTIIIVICFMFAVLFVLIGILAGYISRMSVEVKARPIYILDELIETERESIAKDENSDRKADQ